MDGRHSFAGNANPEFEMACRFRRRLDPIVGVAG